MLEIADAAGVAKAPAVPVVGEPCVLMFSGGRDSTLAALRLREQGFNPTLVTITSDHLTGIGAVQQRLTELKAHLAPQTAWLRIRQPRELRTDTSFYEHTCLPCHHAYVVVATAVAMSLGSSKLAFGYAGYQSGWPEQTPLAIERLRTVLSEFKIDLLTPVYDLPSRGEAIAELQRCGLSSDSLEQKCSRQVNNITLSEEKLRAQISLWEQAIRESATKLDLIPMVTLASGTLGDL